MLETQLHESGLKFTKELGGILEIHESHISDLRQAHNDEMAEMRAGANAADERHGQQIIEMKEEYRKAPS